MQPTGPGVTTHACRTNLVSIFLVGAVLLGSQGALSGCDPVGGKSPQLQPQLQPQAQPLDAKALYEQCRERVEGPEQDGECSVDGDCAAGGCSGEICAAPASLDGLMTTCEVLPCFAVLQSCGCVEGRCSWTVGPAAPAAHGRDAAGGSTSLDPSAAGAQ